MVLRPSQQKCWYAQIQENKPLWSEPMTSSPWGYVEESRKFTQTSKTFLKYSKQQEGVLAQARVSGWLPAPPALPQPSTPSCALQESMLVPLTESRSGYRCTEECSEDFLLFFYQATTGLFPAFRVGRRIATDWFQAWTYAQNRYRKWCQSGLKMTVFRWPLLARTWREMI